MANKIACNSVNNYSSGEFIWNVFKYKYPAEFLDTACCYTLKASWSNCANNILYALNKIKKILRIND